MLLAGVLAVGCGGSTTPTGPSRATGIDLTASVSIALSGTVASADDNNMPLPDVAVDIVTGPDATRSTRTDAAGNYTFTNLRVGAFVVRFTSPGFQILERTVSSGQDTRLDVQLRRGPQCVILPGPGSFRASVSGTTVTFSWTAVNGADDYLIGVGTSRGSSRSLSTNTTQTTYTWVGATPRTYYGRVVARNACGPGAASNEATFTVTSTALVIGE